MKPLTISVAMATYNGGRFVPEQLQSLAGQALPPTELVVTDDEKVRLHIPTLARHRRPGRAGGSGRAAATICSRNGSVLKDLLR